MIELNKSEDFKQINENQHAKALANTKKYDIIGIDQNHGIAFLPYASNEPVKNLFVVAEQNNFILEWEITDNTIKSCPYNMQLVINPGKAASIKYFDKNEIKYILMKSKTEFINAKIFGAVETENAFMTFHAYNGIMDYIYLNAAKNKVPIYAIVKAFKDWNNEFKGENNNEQ